MPLTSQPLNGANLPATALHPSEDDFKHPNEVRGVNDDLKTISPVEHLVRVAISIGGQTNGLELAEQAIEFQKKHEKENVFQAFTVDRSHIEESDDPWLSSLLNSFADEQQEVLNKVKNRYDNRMDWFDRGIMEGLKHAQNSALDMLRNDVEFKVIHIGNDDYHFSADDFNSDSQTPIDKFGYEYPAKVVACDSADSEKLYPFVPWCGAVSCTCAFKHSNPTSTLCKHEYAALLQYVENEYEPSGHKIKERYKRLTAPQAYSKFMNNIDY